MDRKDEGDMDEMNKNSVYMESEDGEATTKGPKVVYAARVSPATKERLINVIERYTLETDKKTDKIENAIVRILDIVESDNVREMHPALDGSLRSVEGTIATLIKQINGIVVGLDETTTQLKNDRDQAIVDKQSALEDARIKILEAAEKKNEAEQMIQQAEKEKAVVRIEAEREIQNARDQANDLIARNKETFIQPNIPVPSISPAALHLLSHRSHPADSPENFPARGRSSLLPHR